VTLLALYHDVGEVITGDLPTPIKYFNPKVKTAYDEVEVIARQKLLNMLPEEFKPDYEWLLLRAEEDSLWQLVKAADKICAYLKCVEEVKAGNQEFAKAQKAIKAELDRSHLPEVVYFMEKFAPSFSLTLDELN
jgi:5'-deoxynucleotidase